MSSDSNNPERYFFIHIQKTSGTSLRRHLLANFSREEIYPPNQEGGLQDFLSTYLAGGLLAALPPEIQARFKLFHGHMPYATSQRLSFDTAPRTFTLLREPIERTLSVLGQKKRQRAELAETSLEDIYNDRGIFEGQILNHQAKNFAIPDDSDLLAGFNPYPVGVEELALAKENLSKVDVIGLQSDMPAFLDNLAHSFKWKILEEEVRENIGNTRADDIPQSLRDRIAEDNQVELEFYQYAVDLVKQRQGEEPSSF